MRPAVIWFCIGLVMLASAFLTFILWVLGYHMNDGAAMMLPVAVAGVVIMVIAGDEL